MNLKSREKQIETKLEKLTDLHIKCVFVDTRLVDKSIRYHRGWILQPIKR